jgi:CheY-like chemotaxis protein
VLAAGNGYEALRMLGHVDQPCLVLLDMTMPVMGGRELLEGLEARGMVGKFPVVVVTAGRESVEGLNVQEVLLKPFTRETLLEVVRRNLHSAA